MRVLSFTPNMDDTINHQNI